MPGLHPFQNATPRHQIPNEAPQYFSPFFEQPSKPPPVSIWQPPTIELPRRSKAPTHRPRTPPKIPTAGTTTRRNSREDQQPQHTGLFQPKKKSVDEIMWLGAVTGFSPREAVEQRSLRSKLIRKPEEIASQASSATGPRAQEEKNRKEEEARAREKRLEEWATKKKPNAGHAHKRSDGGPMSPLLPQPIESRLRPRKKVYTPLPQPEEAARISNRPNAIHRPHMPASNEGSYAPATPFLPQPIETVKRSNRPRPEPKKLKSQEEESLWMGLPQPIETARRSNRKSPLNKMQSDALLPQPVESSRRSNRPAQKEFLPEPIESSRRSNRPAAEKKEELPQPIETTKKSNRPSAAPVQKDQPPTPTSSFFGPDHLLQPVETTRRSHRPINVRPLIPQVIESSMRSSLMRVPAAEMHLELPQPVSVSRWTSRAPGLRRESTRRPPSPGPHYTSRPKIQKFAGPAADHVWHLEEPIDSTPPSPVGSPGTSPSVSICPSLSSSPTSSATSATWDIPVKSSKKYGIQGRRDSLEAGFSDYVLAVQRKLRQERIQREDHVLKEGPEFPFPATEEVYAEGDATNVDGATRERTGLGIRSESSETIRPKLRAIETEPVIKVTDSTRDATSNNDDDDYPICHSPKFEAFKRPLLIPEPDDLELSPPSAPTPGNVPEMWKPKGLAVAPSISSMSTNHGSYGTGSTTQSSVSAPLSAPPRMWHRPAGPSPGYTVASLPPTKKRDNMTKEVTPSFVDDVYRYLSLQFENVAGQFDPELAAYTGLSIIVVKRDRKAALTKYCEKWVQENPEFEAGEARKAGLW
ncbi:hypothetical protein FN846DRAFT_770601 [Sphaerosporella brunnea]|uniref:Uncharacterized protein n=1 Tax=Sphaerosporella brunnea TaxID=1250544 RepID=A0A5J5FBP8_9PEZI|nr:hypothetical protein FN846DRAFT_770601 [Sphaerosporella brunnea]